MSGETEFGHCTIEGHRAQNVVAALRALHVKVLDSYLGVEVCIQCSDLEEGQWTLWPCPTIKVIEETMADA